MEGLVHATVRGGSMRPWLPDGTEVLIRPAASGDPCRAGDVLMLRLGEAWAVHRALRSVAGAPPTRGDWTGRTDTAKAGPVVGRVAFARLGGRWRRADTGLARLAGLATGAIVAVVTRVGGRGLAAELRGRPRRARRIWATKSTKS